MKKKSIAKTRLKISRAAKKLFSLTLCILLLCINSCKKDEAPKGVSSQLSPLETSAYKHLKSMANPTVFSDLDWSHVKVSYQNGAPYLLSIRSKTDNSKVLVYNEKNAIAHARWVKTDAKSGSGKLTVTSVNGTNRIESSFRNGKVYSSRKIFLNGNILQLNVNRVAKSTGILKKTTLDDEDPGDGGDGPGDPGDPGDPGNPGDGGNPPAGHDPDPGDGGSGGDPGDPGNGTDPIDPGSITDPGTPTVPIDGSDPGNTINTPPVYLVLQEVIVTPSPTTYLVDLYSLYFLFGNNPAYLYEYTEDPNAATDGNPSPIVVFAPTGATTGTDPNFKKGQTPAAGEATYEPLGTLFGGWKAVAGYTLTTVNGVTTATVNNISVTTVGALSVTVSVTVLGSSYSVSTSSDGGSLVTFSTTCSVTYGAFAKPFTDPNTTTVSGTYNTSNGNYSINVHRN